MSWKALITDAGNELSAKTISGGNIKLTHAKAGSGTVSEQDLHLQTELVNVKQTLSIESIKYSNAVNNIEILLDCRGLKEAYDLTQIGIYATDPDAGEILFAIAQTENPKHIPAENEVPFYSIDFNFAFVLKNNQNMVATIDQSTFATKEQLSAVDARIDNIIVNAGSTEDNAELIDMRVDVDGKRHSTAGEALRSQLKQKANLTDISSPYQFRGACLSANLPGSGNKINDTYYVTDKKCKFTWNGAAWYQSSLNESDYEEELSSLTENFITTNSDNASYKEKVYDELVPNSYAVLVNTCITISKVLKTFLIKSIKLYVKSSTADTITVKLLKEPKYGSEAYFETAVDVEANTDKLVEIKLDRIYYTGETLNILTESKKSLDSGKSVMYCYNCETGTKLGEYLEVEDGIYNKITYSSAVGFSSGAIYYRENIVDTLYNTEQALYNTLYNTEQTPFNGTNSLLKLYLDSFFVKAQTGKNLAIKNKFIARLGTFAYDTAFNWKHDLDPRYGTLFLPAIKEGYSYTNLGGSGLGSFCVLDKTGKVIRGVTEEVRDVRHYVYEEGDFLVAFESPFLRKTDKTNPIVVAGQVDELTDEEAYEYAPMKELNNRVKSVEDKLNNISPDVSKQLDIMETSPIYSVYNDVNPSRSYATTLWIDHLINDSKCFNKDVGFTENKNKMLCFGALQFAENEKAKEVKTTLPIYSSDFIIPSTQITHRCSKLTSSNSKFPKILDIGDSVTDGYLASHQKYDSNLPNQYWSWVKYFFALDAKEDANDASKNNCKMLGITSINGKKYGSSNSFVLNGTTHKNYAVGKGGWSAKDLNLKTFQTEDNLNPFFDEKTSKFSLKAAVDKFKTLADDGVTRLEVGSTAGTEVTDVNAFDFCTPTHVVINLNHNSSLSEYQNTIPDIVKTIKTEYPDMIVILMSIDETGTYFPYLYPEYNENDITWENNSNLHNKNLSIYRYIKESLEDEANNIYVCSGHLVQHPVKSYPSVDNILPETIGGEIEYYGNHSDGSAPNYHPNNIAHKSWGYQLYSLIKYTLAKD